MSVDIYDQILRDLEILRKRGTKVFGSETHDYRVNPPLSEDEVAEFESKHQISLPGDYRNFLIRVGMEERGLITESLDWERWTITLTISPGSIFYGQTFRTMAFDAKYWNTAVVNGSFPSAIWVALSDIWNDSRADYGGLKPVVASTLSRVTFFDWYRRWLDELLSGRDLL